MDQTLECIWYARKREGEREKIEEYLSDKKSHAIIIYRHKLVFDGDSQYVTITRASESVPFACKIGGCRMPYAVLSRLLDGNFDNMEGFEWLHG